MNNTIYKCEFSLQDLQTMYYLVEKEMVLTERNLSDSLSDKTVNLSRYEDLLSKKNVLETTRKQLKNYYGDIDVK
tara:strand:- start:1238 stop:1462 length:225 start_codon:yes stop_codon:yes gene_type:complete